MDYFKNDPRRRHMNACLICEKEVSINARLGQDILCPICKRRAELTYIKINRSKLLK